MIRLALIRHAETEWNREGRLQGRADTGLSEKGRAQAEGFVLPPPFDRGLILTSPLQRARLTAQLMTGEVVREEPLLIEADWGAWEGLCNSVVAGAAQRQAARGQSGLDLTPPGGESPRAVARRLVQLGQRLHGTSYVTGFTHRGVIRAALALATGWTMADKAPLKLSFEGVMHVFAIDGGLWRLAEANVRLTPR